MEELFNVDIGNVRSERQIINYEETKKLLIDGTDIKEISSKINPKALNRVLEYLDMTYDELLVDCKHSEKICKLASMEISKNATRQGKIDEKFIIDGIDSVVNKYGFSVKPCGVNDIRFCNDGRVLDSKNFKEEKLNKNKDGLKSIDATIKGNGVDGYIFAKVVIGKGGHQDNVNIESRYFIEWCLKYGDDDKLYVVLIDGEDISELKKMEENNVWVVNHVELQKRLIELQKRESL